MRTFAQLGGGAVLLNHSLKVHVARASIAFVFCDLIQPVAFVVGSTSSSLFSFSGQFCNGVTGVTFLLSAAVHGEVVELYLFGCLHLFVCNLYCLKIIERGGGRRRWSEDEGEGTGDVGGAGAAGCGAGVVPDEA